MGKLIDNEKLINEWNWEKNNALNIFPTEMLEGSNKKVWWKCEKGHEWEAIVANRSKGRKCPYCANKKILFGYNDLKTVKPELAEEWNYGRNASLLLEEIGAGSHLKVWWKCKKGHEWESVVSSRASGVGCPYCSNKKVLKGYNDLLSKYPIVANEWDYEKNNMLQPDQVVYGSQNSVWWRCSKCTHSWKATVYARTINKTKCPRCEMELKKVRAFYREIPTEEMCLEKMCPELMKEWAYDLNEKLMPNQLKKGSRKKVWWRCEKGHTWKCSVEQRTKNNGTKCPMCRQAYHISFPEKAIAYYLENNSLHVCQNYKPAFLKGKELDVFLPDYKIAIEYDGEFAHKNAQRDMRKDKLCAEQGVFLIHIRQKGCPQIDSPQMLYYELEDNTLISLTRGIKFIFKYLKIPSDVEIDVERDKSKIYEYMDIQEKEDSLQNREPQLAQEWNDEKNGYLKPIHVSVHSNQKVWWKCKEGHEWEAQINSRSRGTGCPYCSGKYIIVGETDLGSTNPELIGEWNFHKNENKNPEMFSKGSEEKVWWKCWKGHEWEAAIYSRVAGKGCPICAGNQVLVGYNDLRSLYPNIVAEWNYKKNGNLKPEMVHSNARRKVWWKCDKGHEWETAIYHRTGKRATGCPYCNNSKVLEGYNDLATLYPELLIEWDFEKNEDVQPNTIVAGTGRKVWWKCTKCNQRYEKRVNQKVMYPKCPFCKN